MKNDKTVLFLFNPNSNEGRATDAWLKARRQFPQLPEQPVDITQITDLASYIKKANPRIVVAAGGDGTVNSVCQAVAGLAKKPLVAILPLGFGNALAYCFGVETMEKAMSVLEKKMFTVTVDLMKTNIPNHPIGLFNISTGFDARIVYNRMNHRYIGFRSYFLSALRSVFSHTEQEMIFTIDHNVTLRATASSLVVANSPTIGQNFVIAGQAKLNDGLLDCTLFSSKYAYIRNLRFRGFTHPLYTRMGKVRFKAKHLRIEGEPYMQVDGDPFVQKKDTEVEIVPNSITFLRNDIQKIDQRYVPFTL